MEISNTGVWARDLEDPLSYAPFDKDKTRGQLLEKKYLKAIMEITCPGLRCNDDKMFYRRHRRYANPLASELSYSMADVSYRWKVPCPILCPYITPDPSKCPMPIEETKREVCFQSSHSSSKLSINRSSSSFLRPRRPLS